MLTEALINPIAADYCSIDEIYTNKLLFDLALQISIMMQIMFSRKILVETFWIIDSGNMAYLILKWRN